MKEAHILCDRNACFIYRFSIYYSYKVEDIRKSYFIFVLWNWNHETIEYTAKSGRTCLSYESELPPNVWNSSTFDVLFIYYT